MENVMNVAAYITNRYLEEYKQPIDEMKLHKLMYFAQRESFIQNNQPLFDATFYGWKYGHCPAAFTIANRNVAASISTQNSASHAVSPALPGQSTRRAARNTS